MNVLILYINLKKILGLSFLLVCTIVGSVWHLVYVNMTMCHITDLLYIGWLPVRSVIQHRSFVAMHKQYRSDHCCWIRQSSLGVKVHTIPELQLALQTFFDTIYLLVRSFFDQRPQTGGMICQWLWLVVLQLNFHVNYIIIYCIFDCLFVFVHCLCCI